MDIFECKCGLTFKSKKDFSHHKNFCKIYQSIRKQKILNEKEARKLPNGMFKCENPDCGKEHDGSYASGRFCCKDCSKHYSALIGLQKKHISSPYGIWKCKYCQTIFRTQNELKCHISQCKEKKNREKNGIKIKRGWGWNKGLTKEIDKRVAKYGDINHQHYQNGKNIPYMLGKHHSLETKMKISKAMKKAMAEGRAHNIGECRWKNEPSWPEKWFMQVIENEFEDKNYEREVPFHRFSLDFVWKHKKCVIEIDGEQHYRDPLQQKRDREKDRLLKEEGWRELRLDWRWVCNHTKEAIKLAKDFVDLNDTNSNLK